MTDKKQTTTSEAATKKPLDLRGSEQHHDLKNQPGEDGDPNHAMGNLEDNDKAARLVEDAVTNTDRDTAMAAALKDATK